jgi:hypothetical protein
MIYKKYISIDDNKNITHSFTSGTKRPSTKDILIGESKDRHYNMVIFRADGLYNYKYIDGKIVETTDTDFIEEIQLIANENRILEIKAELSELDYKTIKRMQGHYTDEQWQTHVAYCDALRDEMNGLQ